MGIEENQEEDIVDFIRDWVWKVRKIDSEWTATGRSSRSVGEELEFQAGHLGTCLEVFWEDIYEEETELRGEIRRYMAEMEFRAIWAKLFLQVMEKEDAIESPRSDEARDVKEEDKVNEVEADIILNGALQLPDNLSEEESGESQNVEDAGGWTEKLILDDGGKLQRREEGMELANELERMVKAAAREGQPAYLFLLGLGNAEKFEAVFVLVKGGDKFGFKCEPDPDFLGPPPWPNNISECSIRKSKGKQHEYGLKCVRIGPFHQLNQPMILSTEIEDGFGPVAQFLKYGPEVDASVGGTVDLHLLEATYGFTLCQKEHSEFRGFTPSFLPAAKPPPQPPDSPRLVWRSVSNTTVSASLTWYLWPLLFITVPADEDPSERRSNWKADSLEYDFSAISTSLDCFPVYLRISGKEDSAGDDPGDLRISCWLAMSSGLKHNLVGKVALKRSARPDITQGVEEVDLVLQPPQELSSQQFKLIIAGLVINENVLLLAQGNQMFKMLYHSLRPPEIKSERERDRVYGEKPICLVYDKLAELKCEFSQTGPGFCPWQAAVPILMACSFVLKPPPEPPPFRVAEGRYTSMALVADKYGASNIVITLTRDCIKALKQDSDDNSKGGYRSRNEANTDEKHQYIDKGC